MCNRPLQLYNPCNLIYASVRGARESPGDKRHIHNNFFILNTTYHDEERRYEHPTKGKEIAWSVTWQKTYFPCKTIPSVCPTNCHYFEVGDEHNRNIYCIVVDQSENVHSGLEIKCSNQNVQWTLQPPIQVIYEWWPMGETFQNRPGFGSLYRIKCLKSTILIFDPYEGRSNGFQQKLCVSVARA